MSSKGTQGALETKQVTTKPSSAEEMISVLLQAGLDEEKLDQVLKEKGKPQPKGKGEAKKKPAAASKASLKRPAAASAKAEPAKKHKAGGLSPQEMALAREKLFRKVLAELQDLWRAGCSGCRHRPNCTWNCWAKRVLSCMISSNCQPVPEI